MFGKKKQPPIKSLIAHGTDIQGDLRFSDGMGSTLAPKLISTNSITAPSKLKSLGAEAAYARAGAQLTINLVGAMPLNFAAAYSDYHVTGLNPAGNATLTNLAFVASRFGIVQSRRPAGALQEKAA